MAQNTITINSELMLSIFQYLENRPAKEVFQLLTLLGQACSPQFQAIQDAANSAAATPVEPAAPTDSAAPGSASVN